MKKRYKISKTEASETVKGSALATKLKRCTKEAKAKRINVLSSKLHPRCTPSKGIIAYLRTHPQLKMSNLRNQVVGGLKCRPLQPIRTTATQHHKIRHPTTSLWNEELDSTKT